MKQKNAREDIDYMQEEIVKKIRSAKSPEKLLQVAREQGIEDLTEKDAENYFEYLHRKGELTDDELESAAGGCKKNGKTVVTCDHKCHNNSYIPGYELIGGKFLWHNSDNLNLRGTWAVMTIGYKDPNGLNKCGACYYLRFSGGTGYCDIN